MNQELQPISNLQPASFAKRLDALTDGQIKILRLLETRIKEGKPITTDDIVDCYFSSVSKDGETIRVRGNFMTNNFFCHHLKKDNWQIKNKAIQWFKLNLGSCIMKARLLVIPIIEI